ncbi:MAG: hypothetical protein AAGA68_05015 [Pseudomonadota bacterium]
MTHPREAVGIVGKGDRLVGRLVNEVALSLRRGSVSKARRAANGIAIGKRCNAAMAPVLLAERHLIYQAAH